MYIITICIVFVILSRGSTIDHLETEYGTPLSLVLRLVLLEVL